MTASKVLQPDFHHSPLVKSESQGQPKVNEGIQGCEYQCGYLGVNIFGTNNDSKPLNILNGEMGNEMRNIEYGQTVRIWNARV